MDKQKIKYISWRWSFYRLLFPPSHQYSCKEWKETSEKQGIRSRADGKGECHDSSYKSFKLSALLRKNNSCGGILKSPFLRLLPKREESLTEALL